MPWKIAEAKAHFSDLIRRAGRAPQVIERRSERVAAVIGGDDLEAFLEWRSTNRAKTLADAMDTVREVAAEEGWDLLVPDRRTRAVDLPTMPRRRPRRAR